MKAVQKRVILEVKQQENTTESGIVLQGRQDPNPVAHVIAVGPQSDCGLVPGMRVIVDWSRVNQFANGGKTYYVCDQSQIMAVFED